MFELLIQSSTKVYPIMIGLNLIKDLRDRDAVVIADSNLDHITNVFGDRVIRIEANEKNKNLATCEFVIQEMKGLACNRDTVVIAMGGGFIQDVATLASALYMRGISWIFVPTTLMAMMDSCIGGKSSINVGLSKNLIGNFYPPKKIVVDLGFIPSLNNAAIASGLAEGVKICFARGAQEFEEFRNYRKSIGIYDSPVGAKLVAHVLNSKKWFVETDEFDVGPRQLLNFGHTFGHALESATEFEIPHGVAICIGVLAALNHPSSTIGQIEQNLADECLSILAPVTEEFESAISRFDAKKFEQAFLGDKKHTTHHFRLVIPTSGTLRVVEIERSDHAIREASLSMEKALETVQNR